jgi:hypothetical protein
MKMILKAALLALIAVTGTAHALPVSGQGTWETTLLGRDINGNAVAGNADSAVFLYDTVLDVTWLRDANYAQTSGHDSDGYMNWTQANTWAANLVVGAYDDWRLPTMISTPDTRSSFAGGTDLGYNVRTTSGSTVFSEMATWWYDTLGNKAYCPPGNASCSGPGTPQPGWGLTNTGAFQNLQSADAGAYQSADDYWSGLEYAPDTDQAWGFDTGGGGQFFNAKYDGRYALAVRYGDVLAPIPEPETYALMLAGLAVVGAAARRRKAK